MVHVIVYFTALLAAVLTLMVGSGLHGSLISLRLTVEDFSSLTTGLVMSGFYVGMIAGTWLCPLLIRRVGHIRGFAVCAAANTAAILIHALVLDPWLWWVLRVVTGLAMMGSYMVVESWLNERTEPQMRGRVFSVYMAMTFLGLGLGQFLLHAAEVQRQDLFILVGIFYALCLVPMAMTRAVHPEPPRSSRFNLGKFLSQAPLGLFGSLVAGINAGAFFTLGPVFGVRIGLPVGEVANFMGLTILAGLLLQWPVGNFSDRFDRRKVLASLSLAVVVASAVVIAAAAALQEAISFAALFYGGIAFTVYPVAVAHANDFVHPEERVTGSAAIIFCYSVGAFIGPLLASSTMSGLGPTGLFAFIAGNSLLLTVAAWIASIRSPKIPKEPMAAIPMPRTSPMVAMLDPRTPAEGEEVEPWEEPAVPEEDREDVRASG